jgi:uncharacterized membrane protein
MRTVFVLVLFLAGCASSPASVDASREDGGLGSGASCPPGSALDYETFGRSFFDTYCTRCHASSLLGAARMGAPLGHDFETLEGVRDQATHVDQQAAIGVHRANRFMPPSGMPVPTDEERRMLGEWLACGAP